MIDIKGKAFLRIGIIVMRFFYWDDATWLSHSIVFVKGIMSIDVQDVQAKNLDVMQTNRVDAHKDCRSIGEQKSINKLSSKRNKWLRHLLMTAAIGGAMIAVPQAANADVTNTSGSNYLLSESDNSITQFVSAHDATVTTTSDFSVDASGGTGDAVSITGSGSISYEDYAFNDENINNSLTSGGTGDGLNIHVTGNSVANAGSVTVNSASTITGDYNGIYVRNDGTGVTSVTVASGIVEGGTEDGIYVENTNSANASALSVLAGGGGETVDVTGEVNGISVTSVGTGPVQIYNFGTITANTGDGIHAITSSETTITGTKITGNINGVFAQNDSVGATKVTTVGTTVGTTGDGIHVENTNTDAGDLTVLAYQDVTGGNYGIFAENAGTGITEVTANGTVTSDTDDGIRVENTNNSSTGDVTVSANAVLGGALGIGAINNGTGNIIVDATGNVTGNYANGIYALQSNAAAGDITITANNTNAISGATHGIYAQNDGTGDITVSSDGSVTGNGTTYAGIRVLGSTINAGNITVKANDATGGQYGIDVTYRGTGATTNVTTNGIVQGGTAGINIQTVSTTNPTMLTINNGSVVQNSSGSPADLAIQIDGASGGTTNLVNDGTIFGKVLMGIASDTLTNNGIWNSTGGTSDFGGIGTDAFNNNGDFLAANTTGTSITIVGRIPTVNNNGDIVMQNQDSRIGGSTAIMGDTTQFTNFGTSFAHDGDFNIIGGTLFVDANLTTGESDKLIVDNITGGTMYVDVNIVGGQPTSPQGVEIVRVLGTSTDDAFALAGSASSGLYSYSLGQGVETQSWFLQTDGVRPEAMAAGVLPILGSRTALSTLSNMHDRERDVEVLLKNTNPRKGVWARVFGQNNDFRSNDSNDVGFNTNLWGAQAGLDLMASGDQAGNREYAGLYVAYATSSGDARQYDAKVADLDLNATTFGAYYTKYSANNWYLDLVAQYSRLGGVKAKTATDEITPSGNSYALSLEVGKQFSPDSSIIREVQAQLINQYTDLNDVTLSDGTELNLSSMNAVTGRFGLRLYGNPESGKSFLPWLRANIWHTFSGDSTISSLGSSISTPIGGTSGELELGFSKGNAQSGGWGFYGSAGYLFDISGAEYSGWKGTLGLRKGW